jgi:RNA polymerase sigma factor (sigma-70 family)
MSPPLPEGGLRSSSAELFQTTHWSVVTRAGQQASRQSAEALEKLCCVYWFPLYAYVRRRGYQVEEAKDLTQDFFIRILEKDYLAHADRGKGRFRSFLLSALNHFLINEWRRAQALKRGAGQSLISLDDTAEDRYAQEAASDLTPERIYERRWALTLLERALCRLRAEADAAGRARQFEQLRDFLTTGTGESHYAEAAANLGMTAGAVGVAVHRMRHRYGELVREEIAQTVADPAEIEDEIRWLFAVVSL